MNRPFITFYQDNLSPFKGLCQDKRPLFFGSYGSKNLGYNPYFIPFTLTTPDFSHSLKRPAIRLLLINLILQFFHSANRFHDRFRVSQVAGNFSGIFQIPVKFIKPSNKYLHSSHGHIELN